MAQRLYLDDDIDKKSRVIMTVVEICLVVVMGLFIANFVFFSKTNESKSMDPTISPGAVVFVNRTAYGMKSPKRFDVVAFSREAGDLSSDILLRRIIALPGETIKIEKGIVYIDGNPLDVSLYAGEITSDGIAKTEIRLDSEEYFVLGDTPANSEDSRSSTVGPVKKSQILGKVWLQATSITQIRFIK